MRRRSRNTPLRGSVQQNNSRARLRELPRFSVSLRLGLIGAGVIVVIGGGTLLWISHWPQKQLASLNAYFLKTTQQAEFAVRDIVVEGRQQTSKDSLSVALGIMPGEAILGVDLQAAQSRLAKLPWVETAIVERRLPDTVLVHLTERAPMARWQHNSSIVVIDTKGHDLSEARPESFAQLPLVVGTGAPEQTADLLKALADYPMIRDKMAAAVWVSERRWDLHFQPKIVVRMPADNLAGAMRQLAVLITEQNILDRDIVSIDLRVADRIAIEPSTTINNHTTGNMRL